MKRRQIAGRGILFTSVHMPTKVRSVLFFNIFSFPFSTFLAYELCSLGSWVGLGWVGLGWVGWGGVGWDACGAGARGSGCAGRARADASGGGGRGYGACSLNAAGMLVTLHMAGPVASRNACFLVID